MADVLISHADGEAEEARAAASASALELGRELEHLRSETERVETALTEHRLSAEHPLRDLQESTAWQEQQSQVTALEGRITALESSLSRLPAEVPTAAIAETEAIRDAVETLTEEVAAEVEEAPEEVEQAVPESPLVVEVTAPGEGHSEPRSRRGGLGARLHRHRPT
jgi:hypothetical protein